MRFDCGAGLEGLRAIALTLLLQPAAAKRALSRWAHWDLHNCPARAKQASPGQSVAPALGQEVNVTDKALKERNNVTLIDVFVLLWLRRQDATTTVDAAAGNRRHGLCRSFRACVLVDSTTQGGASRLSPLRSALG